MIASHYAEPAERHLNAAETLRFGPSAETQALEELGSGEAFSMLDDSLGWAWGYAGRDGRVGYLPTAALAKH